MKILLDTSVLVASVVQGHGDHLRSLAVLDGVQNGEDEGIVAAHSLAEMYAVLTRLPPPARHTPEQALLSIEENVLKYFKISSLDGSDYISLVRAGALAGIQGGTIYDAVLLTSAAKAAVEGICTLNLKHFQAIAPKELAARIYAP